MPNRSRLALERLQDFRTSSGVTGVGGARTGGATAPEAQVQSGIKDAFDRGYEAGREAVLVEADERIEKLTFLLRDQVNDEKNKWLALQGAKLAEQINDGIARLAHSISETMFRSLRPWLESKMTEQAVDETAALIKRAISADQAIHVRVEGPCELTSALRNKLAPHSGSIEVSEAPTCDLRVTIRDCVIETQLAAVFERITERAA